MLKDNRKLRMSASRETSTREPWPRQAQDKLLAEHYFGSFSNPFCGDHRGNETDQGAQFRCALK